MDASGHRFSCRMPFSPTAIGADLFAQKTRERWYRCRGMHPSLRIDSWYQVGILRLRVSFALLSSRLAQDDCPGNWGEMVQVSRHASLTPYRQLVPGRDPSTAGELRFAQLTPRSG